MSYVFDLDMLTEVGLRERREVLKKRYERLSMIPVEVYPAPVGEREECKIGDLKLIEKTICQINMRLGEY